MERNEKKEIKYIRMYTLRDKNKKSIKIESWRTFKDEMKMLGITESDIFQI